LNTITTSLLAATSLAALPLSAGPTPIDLDPFEHGEVLNGRDLGGVTVYGDNFHNDADLVVAFDTRERGTRDPDLQGPSGFNGSWAMGNLAGTNAVVGTVLILQEVDRTFAGYTDSSRTVVKRPDDEGRRRGGDRPGAGEFTLQFDRPTRSFGFTLIDVEENGEFNNETGFYALFSGGGGSTKVSFADLVDPDSDYYDASIAFGNNSANRVDHITADQLGLSSIDSVSINMGGSGAVGGFEVSGVPTPGAVVAGLTMMGVLVGRICASAQSVHAAGRIALAGKSVLLW